MFSAYSKLSNDFHFPPHPRVKKLKFLNDLQDCTTSSLNLQLQSPIALPLICSVPETLSLCDKPDTFPVLSLYGLYLSPRMG